MKRNNNWMAVLFTKRAKRKNQIKFTFLVVYIIQMIIIKLFKPSSIFLTFFCQVNLSCHQKTWTQASHNGSLWKEQNLEPSCSTLSSWHLVIFQVLRHRALSPSKVTENNRCRIYTWIIWQGKNCRHFRLLTWKTLISQVVHPAGGEGRYIVLFSFIDIKTVITTRW